MRTVSVFAFLVMLLVAMPGRAQTAEERAQLQWVQERGRLIFELDRAAWVGTDDMVARVPNPAEQGIRGYIVETEGDGYVVTFYGGPENAPVAFYRGRVKNRQVTSREIFAEDERPPLTPLQRRLASVRAMATRLGRQPCEDASFNTVVIPPAGLDDEADLYLLTPQLRDREWPLGGHYRATIAADGTVTSTRAFTNLCITLGGGEQPDERLEALVITHSLDPIPTEIHVFTMWTSGLPLGVVTADPDRAWWIGSDGIVLDEPFARD